jgi:hypothetical protein
MLRRQCLSCIRLQLVLSLHRATSPRIPENFSFKSANSPFAEQWRTADRKRPLPIPLEEIFPSRMVFITKPGPQVSLTPVPFSGVNICPFNYGIKCSTSSSQICSTPFSPPVIRWSLRSDPNPRSPTSKLKSSMADQAIKVNFIPLKVHSVSPFRFLP